jgi:hypothetical protein
MGSVSWRKRGNRYLVSWRLDDGSQRARPSTSPTRPATSPPRSGWRCAAAPGEDDVAGDSRSISGRTTGGLCGPLTPTAAPPRWRQPRTAYGAMSGLGSATARSSRSARPRFAAGRPSWPPRSAASPCWPAVPSCIASCSSPRTRAPSSATQCARSRRPSAAPTPSSCSGRPSAAPTRPTKLADCWAAFHCSGGITSSPFSERAYGSVSWPGCAAAGSIAIGRCPSSRSSRCATRPAARSAAASRPAPRATPASGSYPSRRW